MISVIIPVYNSEEWLKKCIESIISQTLFQDMEIILIDDGSTDDSGIIIDQYVSMYSNIHCKHIQNGGVSYARNTGLDLCQGDFISFVDADDYIDEYYIENMYRAMDKGIDITCSSFIAEYPSKSVIKCLKEEKVLDNKQAIYEFLMGDQIDPNVTDKLFRREIIGNKRFDTSIAIAEDKYFLFSCIKEANRIKLLSVSNYHYTINDNSACRKSFSEKQLHGLKVADSICNEIKKYYPEYYELAQSMAIDVKCRIYGEMYRFNAQKKYISEYKKLKSEIRRFSILVKIRNSNKKHVLALLAAKISPALYVYLKHDMKFQYE